MRSGERDRPTGTGALTGRDGRAWALAGENSRTAKLTQGQVDAIRATPTTGPGRVSHAALARHYGVSADTVAAVRAGTSWQAARLARLDAGQRREVAAAHPDVTNRELADRFGVNVDVIRRARPRRFPPVVWPEGPP